jgi:hypothetical protein
MTSIKRLSLLLGATLIAFSAPSFAGKVKLGCEYAHGLHGDVSWADYVIKNTTKSTIPKNASIGYTTDNPKAVPATLKTGKAIKPGATFRPSNTNAVAAGSNCSAWWNKP